jgi:hypothetical protein
LALHLLQNHYARIAVSVLARSAYSCPIAAKHCSDFQEIIMRHSFHRLLQILQNVSHRALQRLSQVRLSSHRAQHMH